MQHWILGYLISSYLIDVLYKSGLELSLHFKNTFRKNKFSIIKNSVPLCNGQEAIKKQIVCFSLVSIQRTLSWLNFE